MYNRKYKLMITIKYELKEFEFIGSDEDLEPWCVRVLTENSITPSTDVLESLLINGSYSCSKYHVSLYNMINTPSGDISKLDIKCPSLESSSSFSGVKLSDIENKEWCMKDEISTSKLSLNNMFSNIVLLNIDVNSILSFCRDSIIILSMFDNNSISEDIKRNMLNYFIDKNRNIISKFDSLFSKYYIRSCIDDSNNLFELLELVCYKFNSISKNELLSESINDIYYRFSDVIVEGKLPRHYLNFYIRLK